jgi:hypothetical protein
LPWFRAAVNEELPAQQNHPQAAIVFQAQPEVAQGRGKTSFEQLPRTQKSFISAYVNNENRFTYNNHRGQQRTHTLDRFFHNTRTDVDPFVFRYSDDNKAHDSQVASVKLYYVPTTGGNDGLNRPTQGNGDNPPPHPHLGPYEASGKMRLAVAELNDGSVAFFRADHPDRRPGQMAYDNRYDFSPITNIPFKSR